MIGGTFGLGPDGQDDGDGALLPSLETIRDLVARGSDGIWAAGQEEPVYRRSGPVFRSPDWVHKSKRPLDLVAVSTLVILTPDEEGQLNSWSGTVWSETRGSVPHPRIGRALRSSFTLDPAKQDIPPQGPPKARLKERLKGVLDEIAEKGVAALNHNTVLREWYQEPPRQPDNYEIQAVWRFIRSMMTKLPAHDPEVQQWANLRIPFTKREGRSEIDVQALEDQFDGQPANSDPISITSRPLLVSLFQADPPAGEAITNRYLLAFEQIALASRPHVRMAFRMARNRPFRLKSALGQDAFAIDERFQRFTVPVARGAEGTVTARIDVLDPEDFRTYASEDLEEPVPLPLPSSGGGDASWSVADLLDHISDYFGRSQAKDGADRREKGFASHQNLTERTVRVLVYSFDRNPAPTLRCRRARRLGGGTGDEAGGIRPPAHRGGPCLPVQRGGGQQ